MGEVHRHPTSSWNTEGNEYSASQFYTRSTDGLGNYRHQRVNVPPEMAARMATIVAKDYVPEYRTAQDLIRDAIHHRLQWLEKRINDGELEQVLSVERRRAEVERLRMEVEDLSRMVTESEQTLTAAAVAEDWPSLARALESITDHSNEIREPYAGRLYELVKRFKREYRQELRRV